MELVPIEREALTTLEQAREINVLNEEQYRLAGQFIAGCKQLLNKIEREHADTIKRAHESHKAAIALKDSHARPVKEAIDIVSRVAIAWKKIQDLLARQEAERIAAEQRKAEEALRLKAALEAEARGDFEAAEELLDAPPPPQRQRPFESPAPRIEGLAVKKKWKARIISPANVNRQYCEPNQTRINDTVNNWAAWIKDPTPEQIKEIEDKIGGVEIYLDENFMGVRSR